MCHLILRKTYKYVIMLNLQCSMYHFYKNVKHYEFRYNFGLDCQIFVISLLYLGFLFIPRFYCMSLVKTGNITLGFVFILHHNCMRASYLLGLRVSEDH